MYKNINKCMDTLTHKSQRRPRWRPRTARPRRARSAAATRGDARTAPPTPPGSRAHLHTNTHSIIISLLL